MTARTIRVSSHELPGKRVTVRVYDTLEEMRAAGNRFLGSRDADFSEAVGLTQSYRRERVADDGTVKVLAAPYVVRLAATNLAPHVMVHELVHAASYMLADTLEDDATAEQVLLTCNEVLAHLVSDMYLALTKRLWATGLWSDA